MKQTEPQVEYPCDMMVKIIGQTVPEFEPAILAITHDHCDGFDGQIAKRNPSRTGKYHSVSVNVTITSSEHLETYYKALSTCEHVKWAL